MPSLRKALVGAFIALNLLTVCFVNVPDSVRGRLANRLREALPARIGSRLDHAGWWVKSYGHAVGLDNRWVMFSSVYRTDWQLRIRATYVDGTSCLLPLPLQGERTFWQRHFADFREAKFHLNIYRDLQAKDAYARHLTREFRVRNEAPIHDIAFEVEERPLVPTPTEARARGTHVAGDTRSWLLARYRIRDPALLRD